MSAVRDGPDTNATCLGSVARSARNKSHASSMQRTIRDAGTSAMCVSGSRLVAACVVGLESIMSVPVSARAQYTPVMPVGSSARGVRDSMLKPEPAQDSDANSGQQTPALGKPFADRYRDTAA